jgi:hypothetical protein
MVKSNLTNRYEGLIQRCEDICGLGATGITNNATLYSQFIGWLNQWNYTAANFAMMAWDGSDFDDPNYSTLPTPIAPHGTFAGTTNRDYNFDGSLKMLKIKLVQVTYDGVNWFPATQFDELDLKRWATHDPNIDNLFNLTRPKYKERAGGFDLYPKFTQTQLNTIYAALGNYNAVYVDFFRAPVDFDTTTATDNYEPCLDLQFHHFPAVGASWEYCKLYKPDLAATLQSDLYGARTARGQLIRQGIIQDVQDWYNSKSQQRPRMRVRGKPKI